MSGRDHVCCADEHCITCGDVAEPMRVLAVDADTALAVCAASNGERRTVEVALVSPVAIGDELLVHAGTAIAEVPPPAPAPDAGAASNNRGDAAGKVFGAGAEEAA